MTYSRVITVLAFATVFASAQQEPSRFLEVPLPNQEDYFVAQESRDAPQIALELQVPREDAPEPFDTYAASAQQPQQQPSYYENPNSQYDYPIPSEYLQVPSAQQWNPENDPALLYELPVEITRQVLPTNVHPKKFDKNVFEKSKPLSSKPKEEIVLVPIKVEDYINKQKQQDKVILNFAKSENQKLLRQEQPSHPNKQTTNYPQALSSSPSPSYVNFDSQKTQATKNVPKVAFNYNTGKYISETLDADVQRSLEQANKAIQQLTIPTFSSELPKKPVSYREREEIEHYENFEPRPESFDSLKPLKLVQQKPKTITTTTPKTAKKVQKDSQVSATILRTPKKVASYNTFQDDITQPQVAAPFYAPAHSNFEAAPIQSSASKERVEFHMQGHDGPKSYKWGFDTGKGHNRQFRYEERDKEGKVKGHYGFYDEHGVMQLIHYDAHPHEGYHASSSNN